MLVRDGAVTAEQLDHALALQQQRPELRLGEILLDRGYATSLAVARVLAEQHELELIELDFESIDLSAALLLSESLARRYRALPVRFLDDGYVLVAVADPTDVMSSDELRLAVGLPIRICVAAPETIEAAITTANDPQLAAVEEFVSDAEESEDTASVLDLHHETPAVVFVNRSISAALDLGASDVHFTPQQRRLYVRVRVDGVMRELSSIPGTQAMAVVSRLKVMGGLDIAERRIPQDGRLSVRRGEESLDVRMATLPTTYGEKVTLRMLSQGEAPESLAALGMSKRSHADLQRAISQPFGAVVVVGPTGSGKTTTLFTCLQVLNTSDRQLTTIEDPVEYRVDGLDQVEVNPRAGLTFASGLRTILRSDPDVLLVGEVRDEETASIAIQAAMTGHLVLTSLHAHNAASAIGRLRDMGVDTSLLAGSLNAVVAQRLARRLCVHCRREYAANAEELGVADQSMSDNVLLYHAVGCAKCQGTGYTGRVALREVMPVYGEVRALIESSAEEIFAAAVRQGMTTLRDDGMRLVLTGVSSVDEIRRVTGIRLI